MFASNGMVSGRQLERQMIIENIGIMCVLSGYLAGDLGNPIYIWIYPLGMLLAVSYMWIIFKISDRFGDKLVKSRLYNIVIGIRFTVMGAVGVYTFYRLTKLLLLKNSQPLLIIAAIAALCVYLGKRDAQVRGRLYEILIWFVIIPIIIILVTSGIKTDITQGISQVKSLIENSKESIFIEAFIPKGDSIKAVIYMFFLVSYYEKLIITKNHTYAVLEKNKRLYRVPIIIWSVGAWVYAVCTMLFGKDGSLLKLMDIGGIPGGFINRQEAIMAVFIVISLSAYASGMLYYANHCVNNILVRGTKEKWCYRFADNVKLLIIAVVFITGFLFGENKIKMDSTQEGREYTEQLPDAKFIAGTEIEKWDFVMSVVFFEEEIYIETASFSEEGGSVYKKYDAESIRELKIMHTAGGGNRLDFSHIKGIIFADTNKNKTQELIGELEESIEFSQNILVFFGDEKQADGIKEKLDSMKDKGECQWYLGNILENLGENVNEYKNSHLYKVGL